MFESGQSSDGRRGAVAAVVPSSDLSVWRQRLRDLFHDFVEVDAFSDLAPDTHGWIGRTASNEPTIYARRPPPLPTRLLLSDDMTLSGVTRRASTRIELALRSPGHFR